MERQMAHTNRVSCGERNLKNHHSNSVFKLILFKCFFFFFWFGFKKFILSTISLRIVVIAKLKNLIAKSTL